MRLEYQLRRATTRCEPDTPPKSCAELGPVCPSEEVCPGPRCSNSRGNQPSAQAALPSSRGRPSEYLPNQSSEKPNFDTTDVPARRSVSTHHWVSPELSSGRSPFVARVVCHNFSVAHRKRRALPFHSLESDAVARNLPTGRSQPPSSSPPFGRSLQALHWYSTQSPKRPHRAFPSKSPVLPCRRSDIARAPTVETAVTQTGQAF
jgi:hypothetical protein